MCAVLGHVHLHQAYSYPLRMHMNPRSALTTIISCKLQHTYSNKHQYACLEACKQARPQDSFETGVLKNDHVPTTKWLPVRLHVPRQAVSTVQASNTESCVHLNEQQGSALQTLIRQCILYLTGQL